jgi:hypothetical protein
MAGSDNNRYFMYTKIEENDEYFIKKLLVELKRSYSRKIQIISSWYSIKAYIYTTKRLWDNFIRNQSWFIKIWYRGYTVDDKTKITVIGKQNLINITHKKKQ